MRKAVFLKRARFQVTFLCFLATASLIFAPGAKANSHSIFASQEKTIFFLDVSKSSDSSQLWRFLKSSLLEKVDSALGAPNRPGIRRPSNPTDLTVAVINDNSQVASVIEIISAKDAESVWAFMIDKIGGGRPTSLRLEAIYKDYFGSSGVYSNLVSDYILQTEVSNVSAAECVKKANNYFKKGNFMDNVSQDLRSGASQNICKVILKMTNGIKEADRSFLTPNCGNNSCSDIVGAVQRAASAASDIARSSRNSNSKMCIAIASDMLNHYPGISQTSSWNTLQVIKKASSNADAERIGKSVAEEASIKFPSKVKVRVDVIGQGASRNFPRELKSKLDAYWNGFWTATGVPAASQKASLDQACK